MIEECYYSQNCSKFFDLKLEWFLKEIHPFGSVSHLTLRLNSCRTPLIQDFTHLTSQAVTRGSETLTSCSLVWEHTSAPQHSTITLPHRLTAKGQTSHVTKDIQVLASANSSSPFSSKTTSGGDKTLPGRSIGHSPWKLISLLAVFFTCATLTQMPFCYKARWNCNKKLGGGNLGFRQVSYGTTTSQLCQLILSIWVWVPARNTIL